jgi:uncharacterized protein
MEGKINALKAILQDLGSAVVAYSGGIDSTLLLKVAHEVLGERVIGVTVVSASVPQDELAEAQQLAQEIGVRHILLKGQETSDPRYLENTPNRCYFCRHITYTDIVAYAQRNGVAFVLDGSNADDTHDHRPGRKAAREHGVRSPLQEAGMTKADIRNLARQYGLPNWNKPAAACLSSRIPYGTRISIEMLAQVEAGESAIKAMGFSHLRVRHHERVARIEVPPDRFLDVLAQREGIVAALQQAGYQYVTLDLAGFRSGSMNEVL